MNSMRVIDSHTGGEPTRIIVEGGPDLGTGPLEDRVAVFRQKFDHFRSAITQEPRGSEVMVGALLCQPHAPNCSAGVLFFNNVGYLGMCGHGTIGLMATLHFLGKIGHGKHLIDTPVGIVEAELVSDHDASIRNVPSFRSAADVVVDVDGYGPVQGDVAYGGNWFFLVKSIDIPLDLSKVHELTDLACRIRRAINAQGYPLVDHVELFGPAQSPNGNSRNFVLCPGLAYDRSPCGTGTSAKLACLAADGRLEEGQLWIQESIIGSQFAGSFTWADRSKGVILPTISGSAYVNADLRILFDKQDPFRFGIL